MLGPATLTAAATPAAVRIARSSEITDLAVAYRREPGDLRSLARALRDEWRRQRYARLFGHDKNSRARSR